MKWNRLAAERDYWLTKGKPVNWLGGMAIKGGKDVEWNEAALSVLPKVIEL